MNLQVVHSSGSSDVAVRSHDTHFDYKASDHDGTAGVEASQHPLALELVTLCDTARRTEVTARVEATVSLVEVLVAERMRTVPRHVSRDDLMSAGMMALVLAAVAFDADRGASFRSFAAFRIRGALIDELRGMDWASRSVRTRVREVETASRRLACALGRSPSSAELAAAVGISVRELDAIHADAARGTVVSLQGFAPEDGQDVLPDRACGPEAMLLRREQLGYLHDAVAALPERLRHVVQAYYFDSRPMSEIAAELAVTQSRVSQMCAEATALIRDGMNSQLDPDALAPLARSGRAATTRQAYYQALATCNTVAGRLAMSTPTGEMRSTRWAENIETRSRIA